VTDEEARRYALGSPWLVGLLLVVILILASVALRESRKPGAEPVQPSTTQQPDSPGSASPLRLPGVDLEGQDLLDVTARGADLSGANLSGARLVGAQLAGVRFDGACLRKTVFIGADLSRASFVGADVSGTDFTGATLQGARFSGATYSAATRWPNGRVPAGTERRVATRSGCLQKAAG
jgi:Pentapeptide repeats (8 copies)